MLGTKRKNMKIRGLTTALLALSLLGGLSAARAADLTLASEVELTGPYAFAGVTLRNGVEVGFDMAKKEGWFGSSNVNLEVQDTASDRSQAISLANKFGANDKVILILGPNSSFEAVPAAPVANNLKVPMLTMAGVSDQISGAGPWSFKTEANATDLFGVLVDFVVKHRKVHRVAAIYARDNDGQIAQKDVTVAAFKAHGIEVVDTEPVLSADTDFQSIVTKLAALHVDCVFMTTGAPQAANLIIQARQAGLADDVTFMGAPTLGSDQFTQIGGTAVDGALFVADYFPDVAGKENEKFVAAYKARYKHIPDNWAGMGYTGVRLAAKAISDAGPNPSRQKVRDALAAIRNFPTIIGTGSFSFDEKRNAHYGAAVLMVKNGQIIEAK
jgi:branched-chain amino acid transport system substrate-binding protein